jgi:hypothetical protein
VLEHYAKTREAVKRLRTLLRDTFQVRKMTLAGLRCTIAALGLAAFAAVASTSSSANSSSTVPPYSRPGASHAECVYVKYRGEVCLRPFVCTEIARSSFIRRVCYDPHEQYMLISLNGTFYHYCVSPRPLSGP